MSPADCICKIDKLGRVLIPKNLRQKLDLAVNDPIEVFTDGDALVLKKYRKKCTFCGAEEDIISFKEKHICRSCLRQLNASE